MEIVEKPGKGHEPSNLVNLVFDYFPDISTFFDILRIMKDIVKKKKYKIRHHAKIKRKQAYEAE